MKADIDMMLGNKTLHEIQEERDENLNVAKGILVENLQEFQITLNDFEKENIKKEELINRVDQI